MTAKEAAELARLKGLLLGDNGQQGVLATMQKDISELKTLVEPVATWVNGQIEAERSEDRNEAREYRSRRLRLEGDNARWAAIAVIAGGAPFLMRFLGL